MSTSNRPSMLGLLLGSTVLAACGGGGGSSQGGGDAGHHFPLEVGNSWRVFVTDVQSGLPPVAVTAEVTGTTNVGGRTASVIESRSPHGVTHGSYAVDDVGVLFLGNDDPTDTVTPQLVPYYEIRFPLEAGRSFTTLDRSGLDYGQDLDGDGRAERFNVKIGLVVKAPEDLVVPAGAFGQCAHVSRTTTITIVGTRSGALGSGTLTEDLWLAPGVGPVKLLAEYPDGSTDREELSGYANGSERHGVTGERTLVDDPGAAVADLSLFSREDGYRLFARRLPEGSRPGATLVLRLDPSGTPLGTVELDDGGRPSVAGNGTAWLLAHTESRVGETDIIHAHLLDADGNPAGDPIAIARGWQPVVASDGSGWLVVWQQFVDNQQYELMGALVAADGTVGSPFTAFAAPGEQVSPAVTFDGRDYAVAFRDTRSGSGPAADTAITAARISTTGEVLDPAGIVVASGPGSVECPAVASDGSGVLVSWLAWQGQGYVEGAVRAARLSGDGALLDGPSSAGGVIVDTRAGSGGYGCPSVAYDGSAYRIAWGTMGLATPDPGLYTARFTPAGTLLDEPPLFVAPPPAVHGTVGAVTSWATAAAGQTAFATWVQSVVDVSVKGAFIDPPAGP